MTSARAFGLTVQDTSGEEELVLCPFHDDNKASAWFNPKKELFYCAVCGFGLNSFQLAKRLGLRLEDVEREEEGEPEDYNLIDESPRWELGEPVYTSYFSERGVLPEVISHYGVRWQEEPLQAAVLPLTDLRGKVQGVQYRYLDVAAAKTRYKTHGEVPPLWPLHRLAELKEGTVVLVVEGAWSAMRLASFAVARGFLLASFALLGAKAWQRTVDTLVPFKPIYLYDGDTAGKTACKKMRKLSPTSLAWTLSVSPDDMEDKEIENLLWKIKNKTV